jgi:hypothetical protein
VKGACEDLVAPEPVQESQGDGDAECEEEEEEEEVQLVHGSDQFIGSPSDMFSTGVYVGEDEDDYTASLAPSAAFESVSNSYFYRRGRASSSVRDEEGWLKRINDDEDEETEKNGNKSRMALGKTSPPKEVLTISAGQEKDSSFSSKKKKNPVSLSPTSSPGKGTSMISASGGQSDGKSNTNCDEEMRMAQDLAANLVRELEACREENERLVSRNRRLQTNLQDMKLHKDEHMIYRSRLGKACLYSAPVFYFCGGLDIFCVTVLLVWVLVEIESYLDLDDEGLKIGIDVEADIFDKGSVYM